MKIVLLLILVLSNVVYAKKTQLLSDKILTTQQVKKIFHWTHYNEIISRTEPGFFESETGLIDKSRVLEYLENTVKYEINKNLWNGIYFAFDPIVSQNYGLTGGERLNINHSDEEWYLVVMTVPVGTRVLDVSQSASRKLTDPELKWFRSQKCRAQYTADFNISNKAAGRNCVKAFMKFLDLENIDGVIYEWRSNYIDSCRNHFSDDYKYRAIVLKRENLLNVEGIEFLMNESHKDSSKLSLVNSVQEIWNTTFSNSTNQVDHIRNLWPIESSEEKSSFSIKSLIDCESRLR
jgi:hypothetical protein